MKKGTKRSIVFFMLVVAAGWVLYALDKQMLFAYMPYWAALIACLIVLLPLVPRGPVFAKAITLLLLSAWIAVVLPRLRSTELKEFYVNAWSLEPGMLMTEVDQIMAKYEKNPASPLSGAHMVGVSESGQEYDSRILYLHKDHPADWCVVYPKDGIVQRVVIHPD